MLARLLAAIAGLGILGAAQLASAQEEEEEVEDNAQMLMAAPAVVVSDQQFEQWVFGGGRNRTAGRQRLTTLLTLQIDDLDRACMLTDPQKARLRLAGRGDIVRFFERVDDTRKKFDLVKNDQNKINQIFQDIQPLQSALNTGLFGDGSIFMKTLRKTLNEEQAAQYDKLQREKNQFRYWAKVNLAVAMLDQAVGMTAEQRRRLEKVLVEETRPPAKFGQYDYYVVLYQAANLPEEKLKPIFDDVQWRLLTRQFQQAKGMEQFLQKGNFLPAVRVFAVPLAPAAPPEPPGGRAAAAPAEAPPPPPGVPLPVRKNADVKKR
jgi:hypothetical protein